MNPSRRKTLALIGGGLVAAAALPAGGFLATRTPHDALRPWARAGGYGEPRRDALSYALLAPSPHNLQPWLAELVGDDGVRLYREPGRRLPETDPQDRQITIGMGCFIELLVLAAGAAGHTAALTLYPEGADGPVAELRFDAADAAADPLFAHVAERRSCKEPFEDRALAAQDRAALAAHARLVTGSGPVAALRALTSAAWEVEAGTARTHRESVDLMRFGRREIEAAPDGIDLGGPMLESLMRVGVLTRDTLLDPDSRAHAQSMEMYREMLAATRAYAVLTSPGNTRADQIAAGRRWMRLDLAAAGRGVALHPVSQCLQEYPEMSAHHARAHDLLAAPGETVQMLGRVGYGPRVAQSPRWALEERMLHG